MNNLKTLLIFIFFTVTFVGSAQIYTEKEISIAINKSKKDSVSKIERLAALKFHNIINKYRLKHHLDSLHWSESLWITTRNHSVWMAETDKLSHTQTKKNNYFTGRKIQDRIKYVTNINSKINLLGENVLYNSDISGSTINKIAYNIASIAFKEWKNSSDHNRNMLTKNFTTHGVAFIIKDDLFWATDVFFLSE